MRDDRSAITIPRRIYCDRGRRPARGNRQRCVQTTRKAAFSALLALVEAALLIGTHRPVRPQGTAPPGRMLGRGCISSWALQGVAGSPLGAGKTLARPMPSALAIFVAGRHLVLSSRALADAGKR
jgi:hypothetical protein